MKNRMYKLMAAMLITATIAGSSAPAVYAMDNQTIQVETQAEQTETEDEAVPDDQTASEDQTAVDKETAANEQAYSEQENSEEQNAQDQNNDTVIESEDNKEATITDEDMEALLRKMGNAAIKQLFNKLFTEYLGKDIASSFTDWLMSKGINFNTETTLPDNVELEAIKGMSDQVDQATKDILNNIDYQGFISAANNINAKADDLDADYQTYLNGMAYVQELSGAGTVDDYQQTVENVMETVYRYGNGNPYISSQNMSNFSCYNHLYQMGQLMLGKSALFSNYNIFELNHGLASHAYNYSTQTFESRREFNEQAMMYYEQGYAALDIAINYDLDKNTYLMEEFDKNLEELNEVSQKEMSDTARNELNDKITEIRNARATCKLATTADQNRLNTLAAQKKAIEEAKTANDQAITEEESLPYVLCYRNNQKYTKELAATASTPDGLGVNCDMRTGNINNFVSFWQYSVGTQGSAANAAGWKTSSDWSGKNDSNCIGNTVQKKSAVYAGNAYSNLDYLNKIAKEKGKTLGEDLGTAFTYNGQPALAALEDASIAGFYNGGDYSISKTYDGNYYCYKRNVFWWITKATYENYDWVHFNHNVHYYTKDGTAATNTEAREFSLTRCNDFSDTGKVPTIAQMQHGNRFTGNNVNLFLVNLYN